MWNGQTCNRYGPPCNNEEPQASIGDISKDTNPVQHSNGCGCLGASVTTKEKPSWEVPRGARWSVLPCFLGHSSPCRLPPSLSSTASPSTLTPLPVFCVPKPGSRPRRGLPCDWLGGVCQSLWPFSQGAQSGWIDLPSCHPKAGLTWGSPVGHTGWG